MATIKFFLQSKKNPASIYVSLSISRGNVFKRKTDFVIDPDNWSSKTNLPKPNDEDLKKLKTDLGKLSTKIEENLNKATAAGVEISGDWLQDKIDSILGKKEKTDLDYLVNYFQYFIENLPDKIQKNNKQGVAETTLKKYKTIKNKIIEFETFQKKRFLVKDVNTRFKNDLLKYFRDTDKLAISSRGRYLKYVKTVCLDAKENGIETDPQLDKIKGFTGKSTDPYLTFDELDKIQNTPFTREALENAKDWLLIGCFIGQRVSDLLTLTKKNIQEMNGFKMIVLTQQKTGKEVAIPIHDKIKPILEKRNWNFPSTLSAQKFNLHIKDIAKLAGLKQQFSGGKMNKETKRKEYGTFEKWELVSSHICRRSFASNFYAETPTALLINITAHSTEKQFLEYIGKPAKDFSVQLAEYWNKQQLQAKKEPKMTVLSKAN